MFPAAGRSVMASDRSSPVSAWVERWSRRISQAGCVLDVAAGNGRHARYLARLGFCVEAVDRDVSGLSAQPNLAVRQADLENDLWPYCGRQFAAIVVTNYLHRPLFPLLLDALAPDGVLIYETFMVGNERYGRPANPDFLLKPNELLGVTEGLEVLGFEQGYAADPRPAMVQRICARRRGPTS